MATKAVKSLSRSDGWWSVNANNSIAVGSSYIIQNNGDIAIFLCDAPSQPVDMSAYIKLMPARIGSNDSAINITSSDGEIWLLNDSTIPVAISISGG